jgi:hypothetical protein
VSPTTPPKSSRTRTRGEEIEQARLVRWSHRATVRERLPLLAFLHHSPNGGRRDGFTGAQMKALGVKAGFPDLILPVASPPLAIEMKTATGRTSPEQDAWIAALRASGWACHVARSAAEARDIIIRHLGADPARVPGLED